MATTSYSGGIKRAPATGQGSNPTASNDERKDMKPVVSGLFDAEGRQRQY
jgi:hypothetical protein